MKLFKLLIVLCALLGLAACGGGESDAPKQEVAAAPKGNDKAEWNKYLNAAVKPHYKQGVTQRVWPYLILAGEDHTQKLDVLTKSVAAGMQPGQLFVYAGPDAAVADFVVEGFKEAKPGTLGKSELLFIGPRADEARVRAAVEPSGMTFLFHPVD